jgi:ABC-type Na+ efflux pump permease subunit
MKSAWVIFRWEIKRILSNWRQTLAVFLVPALVLLMALYLFPMVVDYLSSGAVGRARVILVDPHDSFIDFAGQNTLAKNYKYSVISSGEFEKALSDGSAKKLTESGSFFIAFSALPYEGKTEENTFGDAVTGYYERLAVKNNQIGSTAFVSVIFNPNNAKSYTGSLQFSVDLLVKYKEHMLRTVGKEYFESGGGYAFSANSFNPYTQLMIYRSVANPAAARVIPGAVILLLYYCIYSLSGDTLAADRERGFLAKIALTPISSRSLLFGKATAVISVGLLTSLTTILVMLLSSWANRSNNPMSLIPFGLFLFPSQLAMVLLAVLAAAALMTAYCFKVILDLDKMEDIIMNLQIPLLLFLLDFFLQLFRGTEPTSGEYMIPLHNVIVIIRDVLSGTLLSDKYIFVVAMNLILAGLIFVAARKTFSPTAIGNEAMRRQK